MGRVAIVTDSTAALPPSVDPDLVSVVPLRVHLGGRTGVDGVDVSAEDVVAALNDKHVVTTSRPNPADFAGAYRRAFDAGATHVVSIHLAAALSGTWESAVLASQDFPFGAVRVVDSKSTAMGLGYAVAEALRAAADGGSAAACQEAAVRVIDRTSARFYVDTLDQLRRSGRVHAAQAWLATSLSVKPILAMHDGRVVAGEKVRTTAKALARLVSLTAEACGHGPADVAVHHLAAPERAAEVMDQLRDVLPDVGELSVTELGPVLGAHLGPGAVGTVVVTRG